MNLVVSRVLKLNVLTVFFSGKISAQRCPFVFSLFFAKKFWYGGWGGCQQPFLDQQPFSSPDCGP